MENGWRLGKLIWTTHLSKTCNYCWCEEKQILLYISDLSECAVWWKIVYMNPYARSGWAYTHPQMWMKKELIFEKWSLHRMQNWSKTMPPPPPPPPGPPPPPSLPPAGGPIKPPAAVGKGNRNNLLNEIQGGKRLKKTVTNDRSSPLVGATSSAAPTAGASTTSKNDGNSSSSSQSVGPLPGIGGLFAGGMPTLKKTKGGVNTGRSFNQGLYGLHNLDTCRSWGGGGGG